MLYVFQIVYFNHVMLFLHLCILCFILIAGCECGALCWECLSVSLTCVCLGLCAGLRKSSVTGELVPTGDVPCVLDKTRHQSVIGNN